jgi:SAM-dependent methyltransferase
MPQDNTTPPSLAEVLARIGAAPHPPRPEDGEFQIPWNDPDFSRRMLEVHLDPDTHMASRQPEVIEQHVDWLTARLTETGRSPDQLHILDVGCGPGLYLHGLAERGFQTTGFDFAPAPLEWAKETAANRGLDCHFLELDLTRLPEDLAEQVGPVDAVTFWFGEFNSFDLPTARRFLRQLAGCLRPGGRFILEYQPLDIFVKEEESSWGWHESSLFCDGPHLWLQEFGWDEQQSVEVHVHWILEQDSGKLRRYIQCHHGWTDSQLTGLLAEAGLVDPVFHPPIAGAEEEFEFPVLVTRRREA